MAGTSPAMTIETLLICHRPRALQRWARLAAKHVAHCRADRGRRLGNHDPGAAQRLDLVAGAAFAAGNDRAGMTHPPARRRSAAGDKADDRLLIARSLQKRGPVFFRGAAD